MSAGWEKLLFKVSLYGVVAAQAFLVYIAWGEWNVPEWMHLGLWGIGFTIPQAVGFFLVGLEAFALVVRDMAEARGQKLKANWLFVGFIITFALNGLMDWTGWYSVFGGDETTRSTAVQEYRLKHDEYTDALAEAEAAIARIVGTEQAPNPEAPRARPVVEADIAAQDELDRRWREQRLDDLPRRYVDTRARLNAELQSRIELDAARTSRDEARADLRDLGGEPQGESASLAAINGLLPESMHIGTRELNSFFSLALMLAMKFWIGVGFWASSFHSTPTRRRDTRARFNISVLQSMATQALARLRAPEPANESAPPVLAIVEDEEPPPSKVTTLPPPEARPPRRARATQSPASYGWGPVRRS